MGEMGVIDQSEYAVPRDDPCVGHLSSEFPEIFNDFTYLSNVEIVDSVGEGLLFELDRGHAKLWCHLLRGDSFSVAFEFKPDIPDREGMLLSFADGRTTIQQRGKDLIVLVTYILSIYSFIVA